MDLDHLAWWAGRKGVALLGSGDAVHPGWLAELHEKLIPAEEGLYRLRQPPATAVVRFMITGEISTIYKKDGKSRKVHHVVCLPNLEAATRLSRRLERIGNVAGDGRPILGLDSRHLLEMVLEVAAGAFLFPAHIWTPWFSVLGARSGFDSLAECYGDLAAEVFAVETGLSSDPPMNRRVSALDGCRLVSCSDAHSPERIGREATLFDTPFSFAALRQALVTGKGYGGTVEFFPEQGKYHLDGHRRCGVCWQPGQSLAAAGMCPVCGKPLTIGVLHRVMTLADRPPGQDPPGAAPYQCLTPLADILAEMLGCGAATRKVAAMMADLLDKVGPELFLLSRASLDDIARHGSSRLAAGIGNMRSGRVVRQGGFDGQYGRIRLFEEI